MNNDLTLIDLLAEAAQYSKNEQQKSIRYINGVNEKDITETTYEYLYKSAENFAQNLSDIGVGARDFVMLQLAKPNLFIPMFWACIYLGAIPVPLTCAAEKNTNSEAFTKVKKVCGQLGNTYIICESGKENIYSEISDGKNVKTITAQQVINMVQNRQVNRPPYYAKASDIAFLQFSSGSTGTPKGVMLSHKNLITNIDQIAKKGNCTCDDITASWMPLTHDMGLIGFHLTPIRIKSNQFLFPSDLFIRRTAFFLKLVADEKITIFGSPNFGLNWIMEHVKDSQIAEIDLSSVKRIFNGAEPISVQTVHVFLNRFSKFGLHPNAMYPSYGMAECCVAATLPETLSEFEYVTLDRERFSKENKVSLTENGENNIKFAVVGAPLEGLQINIRDEDGNNLEDLQIGEIYLKGENVTSGYYGQKEETAKTIVGEYLKTGDLGFTYNGKLVVTGRIKDVMFVNGQNIYAHDIESVVSEILPELKDRVFALQAMIEGKDNECIILFVRTKLSGKGFDSLVKKLHNVLVQSMGIGFDYYIPISTLPKTTSGKPQRYLLRQLVECGDYREYIKKADKLKMQSKVNNSNIIQKIWFETLNTTNTCDDFFSLGGDSLKVILLKDKIDTEFNIDIDINELNSAFNLNDLFNIVKKSIENGTRKNSVISSYRAARQDKYKPFPLTNVQSAYLTGRDDAYEMGGVSTHAYYEIKTHVDIKQFEKALNATIKKHDMLRAVMLPEGCQCVLENVPYYQIDTKDFSDKSEKEKEKYIQKQRKNLSHAQIDPYKWPLFNFGALKLDENTAYLFVSFDLLITDGASIRILMKEVMDAYNGELNNDLGNFGYRDYVLALQEILKGDAYKKDKAYWQEKVEGIPAAAQLSQIEKIENVKSPKFKRLSRTIDPKIWDKIKAVSAAKQITSSSLLCALYGKILYRYSGQAQHTINVTMFTRHNLDKHINELIGDFTTVSLLSADYSHAENPYVLAKEIQGNMFSNLSHRLYDGIELIRDIAKTRNSPTSVIMPIVFTSMLMEDQYGGTNQWGEVEYGISQTSQVFLDCQIMQDDKALSITWDYAADLFDERFIEQMFSGYLSLILSCAESAPKVKEALKLTKADEEILCNYNNTYAHIPPSTLVDIIRDNLRTKGDVVAVKDKAASMTYSQLNNMSNLVAKKLIDRGYTKGDFIGIQASRQCETIANIVGVLKSGLAYVPIDPSYPAERQEYILSHSGCKCMLKPDFVKMPEASKITEDYEVNIAPDDVAYIIYTSGSTGVPKGVVITHDAACNTILDINKRFNMGQTDKILGVSSLCFDLSVYDVFAALSCAGTLVMPYDIRDISSIVDIIDKEQITFFNAVPAIMELVVEKIDKMYKPLEIKYFRRGVKDTCIKVPPIFWSLKKILLSGDWIGLALPEKIYKSFPRASVYSLGGATEGSIWSIYYPIKGKPNDSWSSIPYGMPLANQQMYVLDAFLDQCPIGVPGEIHIGGRGVALRYHNNEEKTENSFIDHSKYGRIYATGDYGVMHKEGYMEFLGRKDSQVKIGGHRIELGEIQDRLSKCCHVVNSVVTQFTNSHNQNAICAYYVADAEVSATELSTQLSKFLPDYMIPQMFIQISEIPITPNGKVDSRSLPNPLADNSSIAVTLPKTQWQEKISDIWKDVLGLQKEELGINSDFFSIGGDSISMVRIVGAIEERYGVKVPFTSFLNSRTIEHLADYVEQQIIEGSTVAAMLSSVNIIEKSNDELFPLTEVQMAYLVGRDNSYELGGVSTHAYYEIHTALDIKRFEKALNNIIIRQGMLRAVMHKDGMQKILDKVPYYEIHIEDISNFDEEKQRKILLKRREELSHAQFDPYAWPLFSFTAFKTSPARHCLNVGFDLLIADGTSMRILMRELMEEYENPNSLKPLNFSFKEYVINANQLKLNENYKNDKAYWDNKLENFPSAANLPLKTTLDKVENPHFNRLESVITQNEWEQIKAGIAEKGITPSAFLCTFYGKILSLYSGAQRHSINLTVFNRYPFHKDVTSMVGDFTSIMLLDGEFKIDETLVEQCQRTQHTMLEGLEHRLYDGVSFVRDYSKLHKLKGRAAMPIVFTSMIFNEEDKSQNTWGQIDYGVSQTSQVYLDCQVLEDNGNLCISWDYVEKLFDNDIIEGMFEQFISGIKEALTFKGFNLPQKQKALLNSYNKEVAYKPQTMLDGYYKSIKEYGAKVALIKHDMEITYDELELISNKIANYLKENGVKQGDTVGIMANRDIDTICCIIGIMKTGAAYVPISLTYPQSRIEYVEKQSQCKLILNTAAGTPWQNSSSEFIREELSDQATAYLIYTSGSTGEPKAVEITHGACMNTIVDINKRFDVTYNDRMLGVSSLCFDLSVYDIFGALSAGAALVLIDDQRDSYAISRAIDQFGITIYNSVPAILSLVMDELADDYSNETLKHVILSGDFIPVRLPEKICSKFKNATVTSAGGATEASIWSIAYTIEKIDPKWTGIPYGTPLANQKMYVLSKSLDFCPVDVVGEIFIGGVGVAKGYFKQQQLTDSAFIMHPQLGRIYKTGDLGKIDKYGKMWILGRIDHQVKVNGYRVELEEISTVIEGCENVARSVVEMDEKSQLIAYVQPGICKENYSESFKGICKAAEDLKITPEENEKLNNTVDFVSIVNKVSDYNMLCTLREFGLFLQGTSRHTQSEIKKAINSSNETMNMDKKWVNALVSNCVLVQEGDYFSVSSTFCEKDYKLALKKLNSLKDGEYKALLNYYQKSVDNLKGLLEGKVNPLTLLFPDGDYKVVESVYCKNPVTYFANTAAVAALKEFLKQRGEKPLKALELGAGVGSSTEYILDVLPKEGTSYYYTDISDGFTKFAAKKFADYDFLTYGVVNIDNDLVFQGLEAQSYDLIVASNVLHDAKDIQKTLCMIEKVLAKDGIIILLEGTDITSYELVTVAFLEGLTTYEDERREAHTPFISAERWQEKLKKAGLMHTAAYPPQDHKAQQCNVSAIIALDRQLQSVSIDDIQRSCEAKLASYMIPHKYIQCQTIPLTENGKVNKKALLDVSGIDVNTAKQSVYTPPRNELDEFMADLCKEVLEIDTIGIDDNIYDLGGDSIKLIKILSILRGKGYQINIEHMFSMNTIRQISDAIKIKEEAQ